MQRSAQKSGPPREHERQPPCITRPGQSEVVVYRQPDIDAIAADLRRQRKDLEQLMADHSHARGSTRELVARIEELRRRIEETKLLHASLAAEPKQK